MFSVIFLIIACVLTIVFIVGGIIWIVREDTKTESNGLIERQAKEKQERKAKISKFLESEDKISNNDVEAMLGVSDATAERYLQEFEKEGILKQIGDIGQGVYYIKI